MLFNIRFLQESTPIVFYIVLTEMITIETICYKYKPLKNGELPLKIRICKDRKTRYINLGVSTKFGNWDFVKNRPKETCPNKEEIENLITHTISKLREKIAIMLYIALVARFLPVYRLFTPM